jgi:hypothetical protein
MILREKEKTYYISTRDKKEYGFTDWVIFWWGRHFDGHKLY